MNLNLNEKHNKFTRELEVKDLGNEVLEFSICSDAPYPREDACGVYFEVLPVEGCDWSRLKSGAMAFLMDHDPEKQIGVVMDAWADGGKIRVRVKFSNSPEVRQIVEDIKAGIRTNTSIGYFIDEAHWEQNSEGRTLYAEKYLIYEASLVSVPADPSVGYQRNAKEMKKLSKRDCGAPEKKAEESASQGVHEAGEEVHDEIQDLIAEIEKLDADKAKALRDALNSMDEHEAAHEEGEAVHGRIEDLLAAVEKLVADKQAQQKACGDPEKKAEETAAPAGPAEGKKPEEDEIRSLGELVDRKADAERMIKQHRSLEEFKSFLKAEPTEKKEVKMEKFNLQKAIRSFVKGERDNDSYEYKTSEENKRKFNSADADICVTRAQLRGFPDGSEALNQVQYRPDLYTANLRPQKTYEKLGLTRVAADGDISFAVCTSGLNAGFVDLNNEIPSATAEWTLKTLTPKKMGAYTQIGYKALLEDRPEIQALIASDINGALEDCKDKAIINGSGEDNQPLGVYNTSGINTVEAPSGAWSLSTALAFEKPIRDANIFSEKLAWVCSSEKYYQLAATPKSAKEQNEFLISDDRKMLGYPVYIDNSLPASGIILGDWSEVLAVDYDPINIKIVQDAGLSRKQAVQVQAFSAFNMLVRRPQAFTRLA